MSKNSISIYNCAMGYAGGNAVADASKSLITALVHLPDAVLRTLGVWQKRAQDRAHLKALDPHLLKDMGLAREEVALEISKPFWRS